MLGGTERRRRRAKRARAGAVLAILLGVAALCTAPGPPLLAEDAPNPAAAGSKLTQDVEAFAKSVTVDQAAKAAADKRKALLGQVTPAIDTLARYERIDSLGAFDAAARRLKAAIEEIAKDNSALDLLRAVNRVDGNASDKAAQLSAIDKDRGPALSTAIADIRKVLAKIAVMRRVNIVGAWYGDIHAIASVRSKYPWSNGSRFCSATAAVQALCEGRIACFEAPASTVPATPATGADDVTAGRMCGYDPVPYASEEVRTLVVIYQCLSLDDEEWRTQDMIDWRSVEWRGQPLSAKGSPPGATGSYGPITRSSSHGMYGAVLRQNALGEIRCYRKDLVP